MVRVTGPIGSLLAANNACLLELQETLREQRRGHSRQTPDYLVESRAARNQTAHHSQQLKRKLASELERIENGASKTAGVELGAACAAAVTNERDGDGWDTESEYTWHPMGPGVYAEFNQHSGTPQGFVFGAGWAKAKPFVLDRPDQFRAPPPPAIEHTLKPTS